MYVDITGPFSTSLGGSKYWMQAVDDATRMGFTFFLKSKDEIRGKISQLISQVKVFKHEIKIIRCDNAGENVRHIQDIARENGLLMEFTSPYTPQMNGVAERRIAVLKLRSQAMLNQADLEQKLRNKLWTEAVRCSNLMENITATSARSESHLNFGLESHPSCMTI
jgi:transposase InsO family protein